MNLNNAPYKFPKRNAEIHMNQNLLWSIQSFIFPANVFIAFDLVIKTDISNSQYNTISVQKIYSQYGHEYIAVSR